APPDETPAPKQREPKIIDWTTPVLGDNPLFMWRGIIPADALPSLANPASGYLQACGTPPWSVTDGTGLNPATLPGWFSHDRDTLRAQRVRRLLSMGKRSFRDCQAMLYDVVVPGAPGVVQRLIQVADQRVDFVANAHPDLSAGIDVLRSWNGLADASSPGMTFFHAWWSALRGQAPHLGGTDARTPYQTDDMLAAAAQENSAEFQDAAMDAAVEAARMMRNEFESVSVPWGDVHSVTRGARETGLAGAASGEPIFVASDLIFDARKWRVAYGYGFAMVVSFGEKPAAVSMTPFGSSEDPKSPHFADQLDLMAERRFKVTHFAMEDVQRHASSARGRTLYLRPKGMAGLVALTAASPIEARLNALTEPASAPPESLVPFTLHM
ncbi:MAG: penicillin acylase family protein, partial [Candidatus Hydrogenedentes bacterium]|nr:penicillin acylase family protein [Candidatus Hydrogenedentota bacterium]